MTNEQAIKLLQHGGAEAHCRHFISTHNCDGCNMMTALNMAIEALSGPKTGEWTNAGVLTVHCSNCKSEFHELEAMNYCPNCGARMNGGEEEHGSCE